MFSTKRLSFQTYKAMDNYTVLAVNDDPGQLEIINLFLKNAGFNVRDAGDGREAYKIARKEKPDLIISDVMMPECDGIELCQLIRNDKELRFTPILLVSALQKDTESVVRGLEAGADDYLESPFEPMRLIAKAARLVERKRMEDALLESENRFRSLIENLTDIITVLTPDGTIIYESPSLETVLGYKPEEIIGKNAFEFVHPEDAATVLAYFQEAFEKTDTAQPIEYRFRHKDNSWRILESVGKHFNDLLNGLVAIINSRDITEQKNALAAQRETEERFKAQYKGIPIPTSTWQKDGEDFILTDYNLAAEEMTNGRLADYLGMKISEMYGDAPQLLEDFRRCFSERTVIRRQAPCRLKTTGELKHLDISFVYVPPDLVMIHYRDITEQVQALESLRVSEERFQLASRATEDALWDWDMRTNSLWLSETFYELLGVSPGESDANFDLWLNAIHSGDRKRVVENLYKVIESGQHFWSDEYRLCSADGTFAHIFDRAYIVRDDAGKPVRMTGAAINFTERKQNEEAIRFQAHLLDTVEQAVIATDLDGIVKYWNQYAQKLYGWTAEQAVGRSILHLTTRKADRRRAAEIMSQLSAGKSWSGEFLVTNKRGEVFPAQVTNSPVYDREGKLIGVVGVSVDISERKKAERAIAEANRRAVREYNLLLEKLTMLAQSSGAARDLTTVFRAIYEFTKTAVPCTGFFISLYDAKNNQRSPAFAATDGEEYDVAALAPMPMSDSPHSRAVATGKVVIEDDFQKAVIGQPIINIGMDKTPDMPQSCLATPMTMMGRVVGAVEVQSDKPAAYTPEHATVMQMAANIAANAIENIRLLEEEQSRAERLMLSQRLESVGRLAGGIAHDFNNMLTAINGYSELTLRRLKEDDPLRRNIEEIKKAGERSAALTHQLLAFSRKQVLKPKILVLNDVILETSKMLQRLIGEDIHLNIIPDAKLGMVEADPGQLTQVIMNLVVNARDAMPSGGNLTIETANVSLTKKFAARQFTVRPGSYVMLSVSDTGVGMDAETQQYIFEPFFTTKEVGKGTGLGLATVYGIVKQSGGYVWAYSEPGKGSTFKIYLPRVDVNVRELKEEPIPESVPNGTETILLVEDEEMVRNLSRQILETCGYRILEARNGVEALTICQKFDSKIDLLMTDVVMPQMGGRELAEKLSQMYPQIRLLFTSGYTDDGIIRLGVIKTGDNFIQKPFSFETLAKKVRDLLDAKNGR